MVIEQVMERQNIRKLAGSTCQKLNDTLPAKVHRVVGFWASENSMRVNDLVPKAFNDCLQTVSQSTCYRYVYIRLAKKNTCWLCNDWISNGSDRNPSILSLLARDWWRIKQQRQTEIEHLKIFTHEKTLKIQAKNVKSENFRRKQMTRGDNEM